MEQKQVLDWKDVAQSFYDKSFLLAIMIVLFIFLISPSMQTQQKAVVETKTNKAISFVPQEVNKVEKPPETVAPKQQINIVIDTKIGGGENFNDALSVDTIEGTNLSAWDNVDLSKSKTDTQSSGRVEGQTSDDPYYDEDAFPMTSIQNNVVYPKSLEDANIGGSVTLRIEVFEDGTVGAVKVKTSSGVALLDKAAIDAVKKTKFQPAKANDKPVATWLEQTIIFK